MAHKTPSESRKQVRADRTPSAVGVGLQHPPNAASICFSDNSGSEVGRSIFVSTGICCKRSEPSIWGRLTPSRKPLPNLHYYYVPYQRKVCFDDGVVIGDGLCLDACNSAPT